MCINFCNRKSADDDTKESCKMSSQMSIYNNERNIIGLADDDPKGS